MDKENQENIIGIKHFIKEFIYFSFNILIFCEYAYQLRATIIWLYKMKEKFYYSYNFPMWQQWLWKLSFVRERGPKFQLCCTE